MTIISDIQAIGKILQKADNIELYEKLLTIQEKALDIMKENESLRNENSELKEKLRIKGSLRFGKNMYYKVDEKENKKDGPFCSSCWDKENKLIRVHKTDGSHFASIYWCPVCKTNFGRVKI